MSMQARRFNGVTAAGTPATSFTSSSSSSAATPMAADAEDDDTFANVLSLQLKKPKHWKWELTTSRSCSNIALPRILLYNHKGELLADVDSQQEQTVRQAVVSRQPSRKLATRTSRAATSNLAQSIRQALDREFSDLQIQEATPTPHTSVQSTRRTSPASAGASAGNSVDFYTHQLPDHKCERRSSSLKGVRFQDQLQNGHMTKTCSYGMLNQPTPPSTSTTTTTTTPTTASSSSGPREKRRYRRSRSSGRSPAHSESILERFSFNKGRFSSPEYAEQEEVRHAPRYYLRTSKAGTLVVQDESFSRCRRRRKPRQSSSENIQNDSASKGRSPSAILLPMTGNQLRVPGSSTTPASGSLLNVATAQKKSFPVRRYRSDGNMLLQQPLSTSEEDAEASQQQRAVRQPRRFSNYHGQGKRDLITIDSGNDVRHQLDRATAR